MDPSTGLWLLKAFLVFSWPCWFLASVGVPCPQGHGLELPPHPAHGTSGGTNDWCFYIQCAVGVHRAACPQGSLKKKLPASHTQSSPWDNRATRSAPAWAVHLPVNTSVAPTRPLPRLSAQCPRPAAPGSHRLHDSQPPNEKGRAWGLARGSSDSEEQKQTRISPVVCGFRARKETATVTGRRDFSRQLGTTATAGQHQTERRCAGTGRTQKLEGRHRHRYTHTQIHRHTRQTQNRYTTPRDTDTLSLKTHRCSHTTKIYNDTQSHHTQSHDTDTQ